jgi:hypothetical protein
VNASPSYIGIDSGGGATGAWVADSDFSTAVWSGTSTSTGAVNTSKVSNPAPQTVYQTQRYGSQLTYTIPNLSPGTAYNVRLHFAETYFTAANQRVFSATINGVAVLSGFDIFAAAGGTNVAIVKQFAASADATGKITLVLKATVNNVSFAGIEAVAATGTPVPVPTAAPSVAVAIDAGGGSATGWLADADYSATAWTGTAVVTNAIDTSRVTSPAPQSVYQSQRYGPSVVYAIPKLNPNSAYTVRLQLVESNFTSAGQRVFNVAINGAQVLAGLDIFSAASGENIAITKDFAATADATGTITVNLTATVNNATIAGVQILSGSVGSTPTPTPTPASSPTPTSAPTSNSTIPNSYSQLFTASSPLRETFGNQTYGYKTLQSTLSSNDWNDESPWGPTQEAGTNFVGPYVSASGDTIVTVDCPGTTYYRCPGTEGKQVRINSHWLVQPQTDQHLIAIDTYDNVEVDCWEALSYNGQGNGTGNRQVNISNGHLTCGGAGAYTLGTNGLHGSYSNEGGAGGDGTALGPALGLFIITPYELYSGHVNHMLVMNANCLNGAVLYPGDNTTNTDQACNGARSWWGNYANDPNAPQYGQVIMYKAQTDAQIAASSRSTACKAILTALHDYGAIFGDTSDGATIFDVAPEYLYTTSGVSNMGQDYWPAVRSDLAAHGDANGSGNWQYCLNGLSNTNFSLVQLNAP